MWKRKPKFKEIDDTLVRTLKYGLPGVHVKDLMPIEPIWGKQYFWGFVPNKYQPRQIVDILLEQQEERKRNSRTQG